MKNKKLILFFLVTVAVIIAAGIVSKLRAPQSTIEKTLLFPGLADRINEVSRITISSSEKSVELVEEGGDWVVASSANYPAVFGKVRAVALNLSQLKIVDEKTDNPELYGRLGVEDPAQKDARSMLLTLYNDAGESMAEVIVGRPRQSSSSKPGLYVRLPGRQTALLVEGQVDISAEDYDWYIRELINIPSAVVKRVNIAYPNGETFGIFKETRQQPDFETTENDEKLSSAATIIINRIAKGLEELRADGVISRDDFTFPDTTTRTTYTTFDGIITRVKLAKIDDRAYAEFSFSIDEQLAEEADAATAASDAAKEQDIPPVKDVVANLSERIEGWIYQIPDFKYDALTTHLDKLKQPVTSAD